MVVPQHCVRWIGAIAATDVVLIHRGHVTNLIEVADREPLVEAPTAIATRPLVDIAAPYAHLLELSVPPHAQRRGGIGLATGAIAVEFADPARALEIGRGSGRARVDQSVSYSVGGVVITKKK